MHESEKWKWSPSVVSDSSQPHGLQATRLLRAWDSPGTSTGVGCHCLLRHKTLGNPKQTLVTESSYGQRGMGKMEWGRAGPRKEGLQRDRKKLLELTILMVVMDFHKHIHMSKLIKLYNLTMLSFFVCQFNNALLFSKWKIFRGLSLFLLENGLHCAFLFAWYIIY